MCGIFIFSASLNSPFYQFSRCLYKAQRRRDKGIFLCFWAVLPPMHLPCTFAHPPYQSRCKVGAKSVKKRFYSEGSSSLIRRNSKGTTKAYIRKNEKKAVFLGEERKSLYLCHRKDKSQKAKG